MTDKQDDIIEVKVPEVNFDDCCHWEHVFKQKLEDELEIEAIQKISLEDGSFLRSFVRIDHGCVRATVQEKSIDRLIEILQEAKQKLYESRQKTVKLIPA